MAHHVELEKIDVLMKHCDEQQKKLSVSLSNISPLVTQLNEMMTSRLSAISEKMAKLNSKYDLSHKKNQELMDKIHEKLDEIDTQALEASREYEEVRRRVSHAKRQKRTVGLIRTFAWRIYDCGRYYLTYFGFLKPQKKEEKVKMAPVKQGPGLPRLSRSEHTLTLLFPPSSSSDSSKTKTGSLTDITKKLSPMDPTKKKMQ